MSDNNNKNTEVKVKDGFSWWLIPLMFVIAVVPLITVVHVYVCGLEVNPWFSIGGKLYDFFLYYKAFFLRLAGILILFTLCYLMPFGKNDFLKDKKTIAPTIAIGVFGLISLLSAILSKHRITAFFGGYEQFEGWFVILTYVLCFYTAFGFIRTKKLIVFILDTLLVGSIIIGLLGAFQAFGIDWIQSDWAKPILTQELAGKMDVSHFNVKLNFDRGMSYVTLYNPNYVGTYVATVLPYCGYLIFRGEHIVRRLLAALSTSLLVVTLVASRSLTGIMGIIIGVILMMILLIPYLKKTRPVAIIFLVTCLAGAVLIVTFYPSFLGKLFNNNEQYYLDSLSCKDSTLTIRQDDGKTLLATLDTSKTAQSGWGDTPIDSLIKLTDESGNTISTKVNEDDNSMQITQEGYHPFVLSGVRIRPDDNTLAIFTEEYSRITGRPHEISSFSSVTDVEGGDMFIDYIRFADSTYEWRFTDVDGKMMIYNDFGRLDELKDTPKAGFEGSYHFASRRGYIWSRTIPLLTDHLLIGAGRDNFVYEFPNDDYVGKRYMGYDTQTVTKPHNMYLQIWVQDGLIGLLSLLFLYGLFIIRAFRLCYKKDRPTPDKGIDHLGIVMITAVSTTAYMVVGLANDSTITSSAIFWLMLGCGYAAEASYRTMEACNS